MHYDEAIAAAKREARKYRQPMVIVHAPIENMEDEIAHGRGPFGYVIQGGEGILFGAAIKGLGQKDWPALGVVAIVNPNGRVKRTKEIPADDAEKAKRYCPESIVNRQS